MDDPASPPQQPLELIIGFEDAAGNKKEIDWFKLSRAEKRELKKRAPALYMKIDAEAKQMLKEQKEGINEEV